MHSTNQSKAKGGLFVSLMISSQHKLLPVSRIMTVQYATAEFITPSLIEPQKAEKLTREPSSAGIVEEINSKIEFGMRKSIIIDALNDRTETNSIIIESMNERIENDLHSKKLAKSQSLNVKKKKDQLPPLPIEIVRSTSESNRFLNEKKFHINEWINSSKIPKPPSFFNTGLVDEPLTISEDIVTTIKNTTEKSTLSPYIESPASDNELKPLPEPFESKLIVQVSAPIPFSPANSDIMSPFTYNRFLNSVISNAANSSMTETVHQNTRIKNISPVKSQETIVVHDSDNQIKFQQYPTEMQQTPSPIETVTQPSPSRTPSVLINSTPVSPIKYLMQSADPKPIVINAVPARLQMTKENRPKSETDTYQKKQINSLNNFADENQSLRNSVSISNLSPNRPRTSTPDSKRKTVYKQPFNDESDSMSEDSFNESDQETNFGRDSVYTVTAPAIQYDALPIPTFATINRSKNSTSKYKLDVHRKAAATSNDPDVQFEVAKLCIETVCDDAHEQHQVLQEGFNLLKLLSQSGYTEAQFYLGNAYKDDQKYDRAFGQYSLAAKKLHPGACYYTAIGYETGLGTRKNLKSALTLFKKASAKGYKPAMLKMGMAYLHGELTLKPKIQEAIKWFKRAAAVADIENPESLFQLHLIYEKGRGKIAADPVYAKSVLMEAANLKYPPALCKVGQCLLIGRLGFQVDVNESVRFLQESANRGNAEAVFSLSEFYLNGCEDAGIQVDQIRAFEMVKVSAEMGFPRAQYALGCFYQQGIGLPYVMTKEADAWFLVAAHNNDKRAMEKLGKKASKLQDEDKCSLM